MIVIVRPASVFISTIRSDLSLKEKVFLSFLAPRGIVAAAVASVFALELGHVAGMDQALVDKIVPLTFILIVSHLRMANPPSGGMPAFTGSPPLFVIPGWHSINILPSKDA